MVDPPDLGASSLLHGPRHHRPAPRHRRPRRPSATVGSSGSSRRPSRLILASLFLLSLLGLVAGHVLPQSPPGHAAAAVATTTRSDQVKSQQYRAHYVVDDNVEGLATAEAAQDLAQGAALNRFRVAAAAAAADPPSSITGHLHRFVKRGQLHKRAESISEGERIAFGILVPVLVILSGIFAGLTLGYMSLDETQLHVLSTTGTEVQRARARKIIPIRKDGHLLLTTLLIANMITNETLPIIFDPLISNPIGSVVASIVLIVIFAELIPQSTCSRYGLVIGAYMAFPTRIVIIVLWPVAFPVSRILHWVLGPHHGIVYRRAELKELVAIHAASGGRGGDLKGDTVMIVGGALDLQEKVVRQAMTPIDSVFMLPFTATLDYPTLEKVVRSGHSRIPIYQEFDVPVAALQNTRSGGATPTKKKLGPLLGSFAKKASVDTDSSTLAPPAAGAGATTAEGEPGDDEAKTVKRKKIIGTLLVKSCVLLDPEDAIPVSSMVINALPTVPGDEPLLNVLNAFQEGRSHMAIVSARPRNRTMLNDSIADLGSHSNLYRSSQGPPGQAAAAAAAAAAPPPPPGASAAPRVDGLGNIDEEKQTYFGRSNSSSAGSGSDSTAATATTGKDGSPTRAHKSRRSIWSRRLGLGKDGGEALREQSVPSDATITDEKANAAAAATAAAPPLSAMPQLTPINSRMSASAEDHHGWPLGIITLEDVLEELLGEEILDEYDDRGNEEQDFRTLNPPPSPEHIAAIRNHGDKAVQPGADDGGVGAAAAGDGDKGAPDVVAKDTHTLALPAPALGASHGAAADDAATAAAATSTTTSKPTVLNRLGITRRRSTKDPTHGQGQGQGQGQGRHHQNSQRQASDSEPQLGAGVSRRRTETDVAPASPLVASPVPVATDAAAPPLSLDYFGATVGRSRPPRSSSVPPTAPGSSYSSAGVTPAHSRPPSPAGAPGGAALKSPAYRPVVIRTQDPSSGVQKTTIASEGLLRGRQQTTAAAAAAAAAASSSPSGAMTPPVASSALPSRSQTPAGEGGASSSRGSRFKSQAAGGHLIGGQWISPQSSARKTSGGTKQQQQPATNRSMTAALAAQQDLSDSIGSLRSSDQPESTVEHTVPDDGEGGGGGDSTPPSRAH